MFKNPIVKNILSAVAVAGLGFVLLNIAFIFYALLVRFILLFVPANPEMDYFWFPPATHALFMAVIGLISWLIFRSKLSMLFKAIYITVPVAVVFVTLGMFLYRWPVLAYLFGSLFTVGVLYFFYRTKQPWLYYYTVILVGLALAIFSLLGGEI